MTRRTDSHRPATIASRPALALALAIVALGWAPWRPAQSQSVSNAFTYQGELRTVGAPANGSFDMQFALFNGLIGGTQLSTTVTVLSVPVSNGLFTVPIDFGPGQFDDRVLFLEVRVRAAGNGVFEPLSPRTEITATPYALASKLALPNSVSTLSIADGTIGSADIADGSVGSADINSAQVQRRVTGTCGVGQFVRSVGQDGTVTCEGAPASTPAWRLSGNGDVTADHFVGTTNGLPLRLQSSGGVGINTSVVRGALTLRGPNDLLAGPMLMIHGQVGGQTEGGRIRFGDDATPNNYAGFYIHHDSAANLLHIGSHSLNGTNPDDDVPRITIQRDNPRRVGIGTTTPTQALDVAGSIAATGATSDVRAERDVVVGGVLRFPGTTGIVTFFSHEATESAQEEDCFDSGFGKRKRSVLSGECAAFGWPPIPAGARVTRIRGGFTDTDAGSNCSMTLLRYAQNTTSSPVTTLSGVESSISGGFQLVTRDVNHTFGPGSRLAVSVRSNSVDCTPMWLEIAYDLPNGWTP